MKLIYTTTDGKEHIIENAERAVTIYDVDVPGEDDPKGELHVVSTPEGVICDVYCSRAQPLDHNIGTSSKTAQEIAEILVD